MAKRSQFRTGQIYHIYNRGVRKNKIFLSGADHWRWQKLLFWCLNYDYSFSKYLYRIKQLKKDGKNPKLILKELDLINKFTTAPIKIYANVEMPNHFHLIVKQNIKNGITQFMHKLQTSYSKYFNLLHEFKGSLFESKFKAVLVSRNEQLLQLFRYLHVNPLVAGMVSIKELLDYPWSSLSSYVKSVQNKFLAKTFYLNMFDNNPKKLWRFTIAEFQEDDINNLQKIALDDDHGWFFYENERKKEQREKLINKFIP